MTIPNDGLVDLLHRRATTDPDGLYARFDGIPLTFGDLDLKSSAFAAYLREQGMGPGDRVAVMMRNSIRTICVIFGLAKAGIVWVPINAQQRGDGLRYLLSDARPRLLIHDCDLQPVIDEATGKLELPRLVNDPGRNDGLAEAIAFDGHIDTVSLGPDWPFAIMYTSGTTGRPKGVIVTHRMLKLASEAAATATEAGPDDVLFVWEPLYHVGGAQLLSLPLMRGVILAMVDRFSASRFWDQVRRERATHIHYLGGILQILLKQPPDGRDRDHGVRIAWGGGCPPNTWRAFQERFGVEIRECYGMTESSSITTVNIGGPVGSVGRPLPWFDVRILDEHGRTVAAGERGEIVVSTDLPDALFPGYFDHPEATAAALRGQTLHTGDCGSIDHEGNVFFHGRTTDSVRVRGENVSAYEVEEVVGTYPDVEDCAIIGVPAEIGEQDIKLFVSPKKGRSISAALLCDWLQQRLPPYQIPRYIAVVDDFERTASHRIVKHRLSSRHDDYWDRYELKDRSA